MRCHGWIALIVLAVACGPSTPREAGADGDDEGDALGGGTTGEGSPVGSPVSCEVSPVVGDDPISEEEGCAAFEPPSEDSLPLVRVRIVNAIDEPIFIPNRTYGCNQPGRNFDVEGAAGERMLRAPNGYCPSDYDSCRLWREDWQGCNTCARIYHAIRLEPGEAFEQEWAAWMIADATIPQDCNTVDEGAHACGQEVAIVPGTYEISTQAIRESECAPECTCWGYPGSCGWTNSMGLALTLSASTPYDGECRDVELVVRG